ncbi:hypothetical protein [Sinomicrobium soli]|nr:hypothetical protein [Sinomicrobium sp. N-1-3-6]
MAYAVVIEPVAIIDIQEAIDYYDEQRYSIRPRHPGIWKRQS